MGDYPVFYSSKEECCGCGACCATCSVLAIAMVEDDEGFLYPEVDTGKCTCCYRCLRVCPFKLSTRVG